MSSLPRRKPLIAAAAAMMLTSAGLAVRGYQQPATPGARGETTISPSSRAEAASAVVSDRATSQAVAREQLTLINNATTALKDMARQGLIESSDPRFSLWRRRKVETLRQSGASKAEIVAALEDHLNALKQEEAIALERRQAARASMLDVYDVQFRRQEVERWLAEAKAR